eukprot:TRINITY_DN8000_c0_g1_i1.p2 TRINITY_DN8000_c0_g1~~TRINITY_DN8000_c0_g1_i1.p2  ORF type:complete len:101 (+),score=7.16 TRINITY_DN8000_c0_g1_i1:394-696(+)
MASLSNTIFLATTTRHDALHSELHVRIRLTDSNPASALRSGRLASSDPFAAVLTCSTLRHNSSRITTAQVRGFITGMVQTTFQSQAYCRMLSFGIWRAYF